MPVFGRTLQLRVHLIMRNRFGRTFISVAAVFVFVLPLVASADLGPKPRMEFTFVDVPSGLSVEREELIQCHDPLCLSGEPLADVGPQGFGCYTGVGEWRCSAQAYGFAPYQRVVLHLSDGRKIESNIFRYGRGLGSEYSISFASDSRLLVTGKELPLMGDGGVLYTDFLISFLITVVLELAVAAVYVFTRHRSRRLLLGVLIGNFVSLPIFWYAAERYVFRGWTYLAAEAAIILFETAVLKLTAGKDMSWKQLLGLSFAANTTSFVIGNIILFVVGL